MLAFAAAITATVTLTAAPALASTAQGETRPAAEQPALTDCSWYGDANGVQVFLGTVICEYGDPSFQVSLPNGTVESFAVGTSHAVWTGWDNTSHVWNKASLGGSAYSNVWLVQQNGWSMTIAVSNSSGQHVCVNRGNTASSGWGSWFKC
jgi:hypothetical protein